MKALRIKKEGFEKKIKSMNERLELLRGRFARQGLSAKEFPSNLLPSQSTNDSEIKTIEMLEKFDQSFDERRHY